MVLKYNRLKGRIVENYDTLTAFAAKISERKGHKIVIQVVSGKLCGSVKFTFEDVLLWSELLDIPLEEIGYYFFDLKLSNGERERLNGEAV